MKNFYVCFWSPCGSIEMSIEIIQAKSPNAAIKKLKKKYEYFTSENNPLHYEIFDEPLEVGTLR